MGEFARGIHVYSKSKNDVLQMIAAIFHESDYTNCESDEFDRTIAVIESGNWVSVFDSDFYDDSFNKALSLQTDAYCVGVDLHDGDCLQAILWKNGRRVNTYISDPELFELQRNKSNRGNAQRWSAVTKDIGAIQSTFENDGFATNKLFEISRALAIPDRLALMQYDYLHELSDVDITYLYLRDTRSKPENPMFEYGGGTIPLPLDREPEFEYQDGFPMKILHIGEAFTFTSDIVNVGRECKGITICLFGKSLDDENVVFERAELSYDLAHENKKLIIEADLEKTVFQEGQKGYYARFDEVEVFHSITFYEYSGLIRTNKSKANAFRPFSIRVFGKVLRVADEYEAFLSVHPNENFAEGNFYREVLGDVVFR
jgi:hypothetical protein